jgi:hypothetical protein
LVPDRELFKQVVTQATERHSAVSNLLARVRPLLDEKFALEIESAFLEAERQSNVITEAIYTVCVRLSAGDYRFRAAQAAGVRPTNWEMRTSAKPGRTAFRYLRAGMSSRRQVSVTVRMAATFGPACALPM